MGGIPKRVKNTAGCGKMFSLTVSKMQLSGENFILLQLSIPEVADG